MHFLFKPHPHPYLNTNNFVNSTGTDTSFAQPNILKNVDSFVHFPEGNKMLGEKDRMKPEGEFNPSVFSL